MATGETQFLVRLPDPIIARLDLAILRESKRTGTKISRKAAVEAILRSALGGQKTTLAKYR